MFQRINGLNDSSNGLLFELQKNLLLYVAVFLLESCAQH